MKKDSFINVLVVDDLEQNRYALSILLESNFKNVNIIEADSGEEALKAVLKNRCDLILLDVQMPDIDGFEVARMLKLRDNSKDIPIIFLSAIYRSDEFRNLGFELGAIDYLTKPIDDRQLLNKIALYLKLFEKIENEKRLKEKQEIQDILIIQQSKMASLGEMLQSITHQWNQPLNAISVISSNIENMLDSNAISRSELKNGIKNIKEQINFINNCMNDFKYFYKPSRGSSAFNLHNSILKTLHIIQNRILSSSIDVNIEGDKNLLVFGYENEFKHVIINLLNNSVDAINFNRAKKELSKHQHRGVIDISWSECSSVDSDNSLVILKISDNGGGCEDEILLSIFDKFFSTKGENGTGIGLFMTKTIINERMEGEISAKNSKFGLEFEIKLKKGMHA